MNGTPRRGQSAMFALLWLFVIFVSVFDGYLALRHRHMLHAIELNPFGRALIVLNGGRVWYLLAAKFAGTIVVATAVLLLYHRWPRGGLAVASVLAALQFALLLFLLFT